MIIVPIRDKYTRQIHDEIERLRKKYENQQVWIIRPENPVNRETSQSMTLEEIKAIMSVGDCNERERQNE